MSPEALRLCHGLLRSTGTGPLSTMNSGFWVENLVPNFHHIYGIFPQDIEMYTPCGVMRPFVIWQ